MRKEDSGDLNRREFMERSAKTIAVVVVGSTIPIPITIGSCIKDDENTTSNATGGKIEKGGSSVNNQQVNNYYTSRKPELLKSYDKAAKPLEKIIANRFDDKYTNTIIIEARQEFENIIHKLPYIGGDKNFNTRNLIMASACLAIYKVLKDHGKTAEEVGKIIYEMTEKMVDYPKFILHFIGRLKYGKGYEKKIEEWAKESQKRQYPGDWVATFIKGDRRAFDYGFDMTECGILKFFHAQGADEIVPYICVSMDGIFSEAFNRGLVRTTTLAEGYDRCDFRYKMGRDTLLLPLKDGWPPHFRIQ
jgi:hypothetical protein